MEKTLEVRIKHKYDTDANWTTNNPVLMRGEQIFVETEDSVKTKIGDGAKTYTELPFTDELLKSYFAATYVTMEYLETALSALNFGFCKDINDMYPTTTE